MEGGAVNKFPSVCSEHFQRAKAILEHMFVSPYSLGGLAMIEDQKVRWWSVSVASEQLINPDLCNQVKSDVTELFKHQNITNVEVISCHYMYTQIPMSHPTLERYQLRVEVREVEKDEQAQKPTVVRKKKTALKKVTKEVLAEFQKPGSYEKELQLTQKLLGFNLDSCPHSSTSSENGDLDADIKFSTFKKEPPVKLIPNFSKVYFTLDNVFDYDPAEVKLYASEKKANTFFTLRRKAKKLKNQTFEQRATRNIKKFFIRTFECMATGNWRKWDSEEYEQLETTLASNQALAIYSTHFGRTDQVLDLGLVRALVLISTCPGHDNDKLLAYKRYIAQNYLISRGIVLAGNGTSVAKELLSLIAERRSLSLEYLYKLRHLTSRMGFNALDAKRFDPSSKNCHYFCKH